MVCSINSNNNIKCLQVKATCVRKNVTMTFSNEINKVAYHKISCKYGFHDKFFFIILFFYFC